MTFQASNVFEIKKKTRKLVDSTLSLGTKNVDPEGMVSSTSTQDVADGSSSAGNHSDSVPCDSTAAATPSVISSFDYSSTDEKPLAKKQRVSIIEIKKIIMAVELSDSHITVSQKILKQFTHLNGLESTLSQLKTVLLLEIKCRINCKPFIAYNGTTGY